MMIVSAIVAVDNENGIGKNNSLPWHLPNDLKFFKETTSGHTVIMGRKTFDSLGKPLKNRMNIVVSRQPGYTAEGATVCSSVEEALQMCRQLDEKECFILGGGEIFTQSLIVTDRLYLTKVDTVVGADIFFPAVNWDNWEEKWREDHYKDEKHAYDFSFFIYDKKHA